MSSLLRIPALLLGVALLPSSASTQTTAGPLSGSREAMWPAPTAADWERPCLITWQRCYEDAQALSRVTGKPILVCVNMDGEIASEHYAGIRYRQPEIAALYEPYVTVIASVYRHTPRDHDESGRRILCPRFGSVTCGEHIAIEPGLFEKFLDDERVAPRHIGVELDGSEIYDVYYAFDTDSVFDTIRKGIEERPDSPQPPPRGDRSLLEQLTSPDIADRQALERAFLTGTRAWRVAVLQAASQAGGAAPVEVLRLALFGGDPELAAMARQTLARSTSPAAIDLIIEVMRDPIPEADRDALIAALDRLGGDSPRARTLAVVHRGLAHGASSVNAASWVDALDTQAAPAGPDRASVSARIEGQDELLASSDPVARLDLAEAFLAQAYEQIEADDEYSRLLLMDSRQAALEAEQLGAYGWRVNAVLAITAYYLDDKSEARTRAVTAVAGHMPSEATDWNSMAVLAIFAQARQEAIRDALRAKTDWPGEWLTDVHVACSLLARHPHGTDEQVVAHYDFMRALGAAGQAAQVLDRGLQRFPDSWELHERLRRQVLSERRLDDLEATYAAMLEAPDASPHLEWFAGYASLVVAEFNRRAGRDEQALAAYDRALEHYERDIAINPELRAQADHQAAMVLGGRARVAYETGDDERSLSELLAAFERRPEAAASLDGLNISAVDTAKMLLTRLKQREQLDLVARLEQALAGLDPKLLELPAYERAGPRRSTGDGGPPRRRRRPPNQ